jgi:two-component system chemotaxis response regulator CheB
LHLDKIAPRLRDELLAASKAKILGRPGPASARDVERVAPSPRALNSIDVIGVCASTGGPPVLVRLFSRLPLPVPVPVLLVQHISPGFEEGFARWLGASTGQPVALAAASQRLEPGIWVAPQGTHLTVGSRTRMSLEPADPNEIHCPSGNPLFESLGKHFHARAAGVLLTGMGDDGAEGLLALKNAGGTAFIQDEASSLIWGMPKAARLLGASHYELNPEGIARMLTQLLVARPGVA